MEKVIYSNTMKVEMWSLGTYTVEVTTYIIEHTFFGFKWYKVHQNNPRIKNPNRDGEYSSNTLLASVRNCEKQKAKLWLCKYKQQNIINYEKESN